MKVNKASIFAMIATALFCAGGVIAGSFFIIIPVPNNNAYLVVVAITVIGTIFIGSSFFDKSRLIEKLNAIGRPTTSIETGQKYEVLSIVIPDKQNSGRERKTSLLLQGGGEIIFYQREIEKTPIMPEIGDIIILTKTGELVIIRKE